MVLILFRTSEDWQIGKNVEEAGSYSSDGVIPDIDGGIYSWKFQIHFQNFF